MDRCVRAVKAIGIMTLDKVVSTTTVPPHGSTTVSYSLVAEELLVAKRGFESPRMQRRAKYG